MAEFRPSSLEDLCDLMCGNSVHIGSKRRKKKMSSEEKIEKIRKIVNDYIDDKIESPVDAIELIIQVIKGGTK